MKSLPCFPGTLHHFSITCCLFHENHPPFPTCGLTIIAQPLQCSHVQTNLFSKVKTSRPRSIRKQNNKGKFFGPVLPQTERETHQPAGSGDIFRPQVNLPCGGTSDSTLGGWCDRFAALQLPGVLFVTFVIKCELRPPPVIPPSRTCVRLFFLLSLPQCLSPRLTRHGIFHAHKVNLFICQELQPLETTQHVEFYFFPPAASDLH